MIDQWFIVSFAHFAIFGILLTFLGLTLPSCITSYYSCIANFLLYIYVAGITFEIIKKWCLSERVEPKNKAVFITGCASGFGYQLAKRLDSSGYHVFAGCRDANSAGAKDLKTNCSKRLQMLQIDVTSDASVKNAVDFVKESLGTSELWALVNNAGVMKGFGVELLTSMEDYRDVFEVNTFGPVRVTKAFLPLLRQSRGRIIEVSSLGGRLPMFYCAPYSMSKHASVAFTECLKHEINAWGIRVISIEPEAYKTGLTNLQTVQARTDEALSKMPPHVRKDYGEKFLYWLKILSMIVFGEFSSGNTDVVLDAMFEAISLKYPNSVYKPCRNILMQVILYLFERIPVYVLYKVMDCFSIIFRFPIPKAD